jgi:endonuclease-3 related protein
MATRRLATPCRLRLPGPALLRRAYELMRRKFGHQRWWPAQTPFEVCVGAILTQNTNWANVTRAIANLKTAGPLRPDTLLALPQHRLARLIRPAGYYNVKARRLRAFLRVLVRDFGGELNRLFDGPTEGVRDRLLAIEGIGPETADSMLLYAGGHFSFVVDAYTKRIFVRHGWCRPEATYAELQQLLATALDGLRTARRLDLWQDYHAQLVRVGHTYCRAGHPNCSDCPLRSLLPGRPKRLARPGSSTRQSVRRSAHPLQRTP